MGKLQKLLILLSLVLMFLTYQAMSTYLEKYDYFFKSSQQFTLVCLTHLTLKWRGWLVCLPFVFPWMSLLFRKKYHAFGTVLLLSTLISSLALLALMQWSITVMFYPIGHFIE